MSFRRNAATLLAGLALAATPLPAPAETGAAGPGTRIESLTADGTTFRNILIRSVNVHSIVFTYAGGMASLPLRELAPEWQARFHYNPAADVEEKPAPRPPLVLQVKPATPKKNGRFDEVLEKFGQPAIIQAKIDLRPKFHDFGLFIKDQGIRPTCAVFAVIGALEYQYADLNGKPERFSEEYLTWATRKTVQSVDLPGTEAAARPKGEDGDEGFSLLEVIDALRGYGVPLESTMPRQFGAKVAEIKDPDPKVIEEAKTHQQVFVHLIPGRDNETRINNIIQALNAGIPVPIGVSWPAFRSIRSGYMDLQIPISGNGHAVTLVGYEAPGRHLEASRFFFRNSYGAEWGRAGYGVATYQFLVNNLEEAVLLEVQAPPAARP